MEIHLIILLNLKPTANALIENNKHTVDPL